MQGVLRGLHVLMARQPDFEIGRLFNGADVYMSSRNADFSRGKIEHRRHTGGSASDSNPNREEFESNFLMATETLFGFFKMHARQDATRIRH